MRCCRTVFVIALLGSVPVIAAVLVMRIVLPVGQSQAATPVQQAAPAPVVQQGTEQLLVLAAARFLPAGTLLADEHLTEIGIAANLVGRGHIRVGGFGGNEVPYGFVLREAVAVGAPLTWPSLVGPRHREFLATALKPGMRAVSIELGAATVGSGTVEPGDRVDVMLTGLSRERGDRSVLARRFLEDVRVVAVDRRIGNVTDASAPGHGIERGEIVTATLEVLPSQTGLLALGMLEGELSLTVRPPAVAGERVQAFDAVDAQGLPVLPQEDLKQASLQQSVRLVRGRAVGDIVFGDDLQPALRPKSVLEQSGLEEAREVELLRPRTAGQPGFDDNRSQPTGASVALPVEAAPDRAAEFASALPEDTLAKGEPPAALRAGPQHAVVGADPGPGGILVRQVAGGIAPPVAADPAGVTMDSPGPAAASPGEAGAIENGLDAGAERELLPQFELAQPVLDVASEARDPRGAAQTGAAESGATAEPASNTTMVGMPGESDRLAASNVGAPRMPSAAEANPGGVLVQRLAGSIALPGVANRAGTAAEPIELAAASIPEAATAESGPATRPESQPVPELDPGPLSLEIVPGKLARTEAALAGEVGPATTEATSLSSLSEGASDDHAPPLALDPVRPSAVERSRYAELATGNVVPPVRGAASTDAADSEVAAGLAANLIRNQTLVQHDLAAKPKPEPSRTDRAARPGPQGVAAEQSRLEPTAAEQAVEAAVSSLPWAMLSANGVTIVGGGALLLGWTGAFLWLRRQKRSLRIRLQSVSAPLTGYGTVEKIAPEESIFRQTRPDSRLSWLWRRIERRYPLIDAPQVFPRLLGVGVLAAALVWAGMWVMGMSGAVSLIAAAIGGFASAWFFLRRVQARMETQFIQQFPEIVDQIVRLSGAGLPPLEALGKVAEDAQQPVKGVLEEVSDALLAGLDADTALGMVAERLRLAEFTLFAAVIRLQRRAGGSISGAFSNLANTLRARRATALKAKASTAQTRLTLLVLMLMPPLVLGVQSMTQPGSVDLLFNTEDGQTLLQLGVALIVTGLVVARQIAARGAK